MWYAVVLYIRLVGSIVQDEGIVLQRIVYPFAQLLFRQHGARGVIGVAQIYHVDTVVGYGGYKLVLGGTRHVGYIAPYAVF